MARAPAGHDGVLAPGGGAVLDPRTRALPSGLPVVFLDADAGAAVRRRGGAAGTPAGRCRRVIRTGGGVRRPRHAVRSARRSPGWSSAPAGAPRRGGVEAVPAAPAPREVKA
ncbi:hypothetical protein ACF1FC_01345 [Streptomyces sp. NPDC014344]|uniref:hypothetical protein n=1 Tax=Streptomyces sp. NPDC014344 TaxID=3364871 RepID=UPI0036FAF31B